MPLWNDFRSAHAFVPLCFSFHLFSANKSKSLLLLFYREKRLPLRLLSLQTEEKAAFCVQQSQSLCVDVFPKKWNPDNIFAFAKRSIDKHRFANIAEKCSFFRGKWSVERGKSTCTVHNALRRKLYPINENRLPNRKYITIQFWICLAADVQVHKSTACEFVCVGECDKDDYKSCSFTQLCAARFSIWFLLFLSAFLLLEDFCSFAWIVVQTHFMHKSKVNRRQHPKYIYIFFTLHRW